MADAVFSQFDVRFDVGHAEQPVFEGGEILRGALYITLRRPMVIDAIRLELRGRAVFRADPNSKSDVVQKVLFDQSFTLLERPPGQPEPGHFPWIADFPYRLPFECPLPKGCPTSYEGPYAHVRYSLRLSLQEDLDGKQYSYLVKKAFTMIARPDESTRPVAGEPAQVEETVATGGCCCRGKMWARLSLEKSGFVPGERIDAVLEVDNSRSRQLLSNMEVRLVDRAICVSAGAGGARHSPQRTLLVQPLDLGEIEPKQKATRIPLTLLTVPPLPPSSRDVSSLDSWADAQPSNNNENGGIGNQQQRLLTESMSTATLRFRRQPFLRLNYAVQVTMGRRVLLELPINVGALALDGGDSSAPVSVQPYIAGPQPISDQEDNDQVMVGGPFVYTPVYPTLTSQPSPAPPTESKLAQLSSVPEEEPHELAHTEIDEEKTALLVATANQPVAVRPPSEAESAPSPSSRVVSVVVEERHHHVVNGNVVGDPSETVTTKTTTIEQNGKNGHANGHGTKHVVIVTTTSDGGPEDDDEQPLVSADSQQQQQLQEAH